MSVTLEDQINITEIKLPSKGGTNWFEFLFRIKGIAFVDSEKQRLGALQSTPSSVFGDRKPILCPLLVKLRLDPARLAPDYGFLFVDHHTWASSLGL